MLPRSLRPRRARRAALLSMALVAGLTVGPAMTTAPGAEAEAAGVTWKRVLRHDFQSLWSVGRMQSPVDVNSGLRPSDSTNEALQKPVVRDNVFIAGDPAAYDGKALAVVTRQSTYQTSSGTKFGWTNGRATLNDQDQAPPVRIRMRMRMTKSIGVKSAVMWWPAQGWPWEVDFAENFAGESLTDKWGSRTRVAQRWHADLNGDGMAKEQLFHDVILDATKYHVYDLFITPSRMWITVDGTWKFETTDKRYIPTGAGFWTVGKALGPIRDMPTRTNDGVYVDWLEIYKPA